MPYNYKPGTDFKSKATDDNQLMMYQLISLIGTTRTILNTVWFTPGFVAYNWYLHEEAHQTTQLCER